MYNPVSTIRLQFHKEFTFKDLDQLIPLFSSMGIGTIYASPVFKAVKGSNHGYDVVDPWTINPEIGTIEEFEKIIHKLRKHNIGWIQDIVPNHMAFNPSNTLLMDVLEKGPDSEFAHFFDAPYAGDFFQPRLMVPVLDGSLDDVIATHDLKIVEDGKLYFEYGNDRYPLNAQAKTLIDKPVDEVNSDPVLLREIESVQYYRLCNWRETNSSINYRRFFTVNGLICLNMQLEEVFQEYHSLIRGFIKKGLVDGLRIDHIDGLLDPEGYLRRLRALAGRDTYLIIEKILEPGEKLQVSWPVQGTSGYEFLAILNNVFTWTKAERQFDIFYNEIITNVKSFERRVHEKKALILFESMAGELDNLAKYFQRLGLSADDRLVKNTIASFLIHCPWYRFYGNEFPLKESEQRMVSDVLDDVRRDKSLETDSALLEDALVEKPAEGDKDFNRRALAFYQRLMQFTGPLMAKGVEDTLMYTFNRFIGHNEVGDSAEDFGASIRSFHSTMKERQANWPLALNATSTHDTKRGEDVRMRLSILTDLADQWLSLSRDWLELEVEASQHHIDRGERYFILQTIVGCFPMNEDTTDLLPRLNEYFKKAFREAKRHTNWNDPDNAFEDAVISYVRALLDDRRFLDAFLPFQRKVSDFGMLNSLSQLVLKMTCPGVPDIYQASLAWDLSLVDPDNRRKVDYLSFQQIIDSESDPISLWETRRDGRIKFLLTKRLLQLRKSNVNLFANGTYVPLEANGKYKDHILTFARQYHDACIVVIIPLHIAGIIDRIENVGVIDWSDTFISLPEGTPSQWTDKLEDRMGSHEGRLCLADVFDQLPIAVLEFKRKAHHRKAGILLPLTSLPSSAPVGDFGPAARSFADFLFRSGQRVWQMLPLNATDATVGFSPYSAYSSIAGNSLLISLDDLAEEGLLAHNDIYPKRRPGITRNDFATAYKMKDVLLTRAWENFKKTKPASMTDDFAKFVEVESEWLNDFAMFELIFRSQGTPWFEWPLPLRDRDHDTIQKIEHQHHDELLRIKWIQFIFLKQAKALRQYCNTHGISLMGDLPFYVSHNSVDVWMNRGLFDIDDDGKIAGMAGVPPDYFNSDGQSWGMPVYRWDRMKDDKYSWWTLRIRKNVEIFDSLRLDHFRAFSKFWKVPGGEKTAINGTWENGPGSEIFQTILESVGNVDFVAEDLGDVDQGVFDLRDELSLPGMKVLQFAFGNDYPESIHLPHHHSANFIVYTGTHDNNTSRGWYENDITEVGRMNLRNYGGTSSKKMAAHALIKMAYASVANTAIIPLQDILDLPGSARINRPSSTTGNWIWRLRSIPGPEVEAFLNNLRHTYDR